MKTIKLQCESTEIVVKELDGIYSIESDLLTSLVEAEEEAGEPENTELRAAFGAIESLVLAHAAAGVKVGSVAYAKGIDDALEAIVNNSD